MAPPWTSVLASSQHSRSVFTWLSLHLCLCGSSLSKDTNHAEGRFFVPSSYHSHLSKCRSRAFGFSMNSGDTFQPSDSGTEHRSWWLKASLRMTAQVKPPALAFCQRLYALISLGVCTTPHPAWHNSLAPL